MTHLAEQGGIRRTDRTGKTPRGYTAYFWVHAAYAGEAAPEAQLELFNT
jgi:hypothetical protein